jgi:putative ABC transport system ATP-binding protein
MISVSELLFRYSGGDFALRIPHLEFKPGLKYAVIGPSGSGKTTLLHLIAGILLPVTGSIRVAGHAIQDLPESRRRDFRIRNFGLVFQEFELLEYLSTLDNILLPFRINRSLHLSETIRSRAIGLAKDVGITKHLARFPGELSQGEKQRTAVARAILPEPGFVLADEPTGNLDPVNKDNILRLLGGYVERSGSTLITVTHDREILSFFDSVVDMGAFQDGSEGTGAEAVSTPDNVESGRPR